MLRYPKQYSPTNDVDQHQNSVLETKFFYPPRTCHCQRRTARSHQSGWDHSQSPPHINRRTTIHYAFQMTLTESTLHSMQSSSKPTFLTTIKDFLPERTPNQDLYQNSNMRTATKSKRSSNPRPTPRKEPSITSLNGKVRDPQITHENQLRTSTKKHLTSSTNARKPRYPTSQQTERRTERGKHAPQERKYGTNFFNLLLREGVCKCTVFYRTPAPIIVYYFLHITCLLYLLFLIKHVRTSG